MFTGIIEDLGQVKSIRTSASGANIQIYSPEVVEDTNIGDSIAVNGVCLTAAAVEGDTFFADVMPQTLKTANLGTLKANDRVNLERSLKVSDRFGGHFVLGHVDQVGKVMDKREEGNATILKISVPGEIAAYLVPKGSIAVDGISLTIAETIRDGFIVSIVPHTLKTTTLGRVKVGAVVNLEADMIAKYVKKMMDGGTESSSTLDLLSEYGYLD